VDQLVSFLQVQSACGRKGPSVDELLRCVNRGTADGVLESALHLPERDYEIVEGAVKRLRKNPPDKPKTRRRRT
jgi:hypothetical protein